MNCTLMHLKSKTRKIFGFRSAYVAVHDLFPSTSGAPGAARTRNLLIRSQALCPIELRGLAQIILHSPIPGAFCFASSRGAHPQNHPRRCAPGKLNLFAIGAGLRLASFPRQCSDKALYIHALTRQQVLRFKERRAGAHQQPGSQREQGERSQHLPDGHAGRGKPAHHGHWRGQRKEAEEHR